MRIYKNFSLKNHNAFKVPIHAKYFISPTNLHDLKKAVSFAHKNHLNILILGSGMNTLFTKVFDGLVLKPNISGIKLVKTYKDHVIVEAGAGVDWIKFVKYCLKNNWNGLENLSLIPGTVGAAPIQNIAAYGQNFEDVFYSLKAMDLNKLSVSVFRKKDCGFGYRTSYFKTRYKNKYAVISVMLRLNRKPHINTSYHSRYDSLIGELEKYHKPPFTPKQVSNAVIRIRRKKFPDWSEFGTAGSFFLNPVISKTQLNKIQSIAPGVQYYPVDKLSYPQPDDPTFDHSKYVKVAAGWLLEELGWRGKKIGNVGTSVNQSLVVINYKNANATEILEFIKKMQRSFYNKYKIRLEPEVNII